MGWKDERGDVCSYSVTRKARTVDCLSSFAANVRSATIQRMKSIFFVSKKAPARNE